MQPLPCFLCLIPAASEISVLNNNNSDNNQIDCAAGFCLNEMSFWCRDSSDGVDPVLVR